MSQKHKAAIQKQFTETLDAYSKYAVKDTPEVMEEKAMFASPQLTDFAMDVACGPGTMTLALAAHVRFAVGVDLTHAMLLRAREFQSERQIAPAGFTGGEAERLPFPDGTFDLVTCQSAFHHMLKPESVLKEMARVAKSEGRLMVVDTLGPEDEEKWQLYNQIEKTRDPSHTNSLRLTAFLKLFDSLRLNIVRQSIKRRERSFRQWMLRAGVASTDPRYQETRKLLEESAPGDNAGHSPRAQGDDIVIVHHEAIFLLKP
ncbi:MAG: class I SAM-dependent methyltransferase [Terriglobia bacterium]